MGLKPKGHNMQVHKITMDSSFKFAAVCIYTDLMTHLRTMEPDEAVVRIYEDAQEEVNGVVAFLAKHMCKNVVRDLARLALEKKEGVSNKDATDPQG